MHKDPSCLFLVVAQVVFVGGLFPQFALDSKSQFVIDQAGVRQMAAVQMAINRVNDKYDGIHDKLLPRTKVRLISIPLLPAATLTRLAL